MATSKLTLDELDARMLRHALDVAALDGSILSGQGLPGEFAERERRLAHLQSRVAEVHKRLARVSR
jgi:hypothetical protein